MIGSVQNKRICVLEHYLDEKGAFLEAHLLIEEDDQTRRILIPEDSLLILQFSTRSGQLKVNIKDDVS